MGNREMSLLTPLWLQMAWLLIFFPPLISNIITPEIMDKVEVANSEMKWKFSCVMFIVG